MVSDADRVRAAVDALRDECAAFVAELVRIPTVNPPGERYEDCARLIGDRLAAFGYAVEYVRPRVPGDGPPRVNVFGRIEGAVARPTLH
ncbi:MAG: succinyl-diaminopimelate desuccinylase, partial [Chloroflexota bacterium]|nr:succinyl-diaminopimelate desuccinylase [Chloroflexota bacterium]